MIAYLLSILACLFSVSIARPMLSNGELSSISGSPDEALSFGSQPTDPDMGQISLPESSKGNITLPLPKPPLCIPRPPHSRPQQVITKGDCYIASDEILLTLALTRKKFLCPAGIPIPDAFLLPISKHIRGCLLTLDIPRHATEDPLRCIKLDVDEVRQSFKAVIHTCVEGNFRGGRFNFGSNNVAQVTAWEPSLTAGGTATSSSNDSELPGGRAPVSGSVEIF